MSDEYGFTLVSFARLIHIGDNDDDDDERYIQASEAQMVYYVEDELDKNWFIHIHLKPRDLYNMTEDDVDNFHESKQQNLKTLFSYVEGNMQLIMFSFLLFHFKLVFFIVEIDVFILLFVDHLKMKKISTNKNSSDLHTIHKSFSTWRHVVDHRNICSPATYHPSHPNNMFN